VILNEEDAHTVVLSLTTAAAAAGAEVPDRTPMPDEAESGKSGIQARKSLKY
jgi:hypothetical protein